MKLSRRTFLAALLAGAAGTALTACGASAQNTAASEAAAPAAAALISLSDYPEVYGSTALAPLMAAMMHETTGTPLETAQSDIAVCQTDNAWLALLADSDPSYQYSPALIVAYEMSQEMQRRAKEADDAPESTAIGRDGLVFFVSDDNPVKKVTRQQLADIYAGKITRWKELGGDDVAITAYQCEYGCASQTLFLQLFSELVEQHTLAEPPTELFQREEQSVLDRAVAVFRATPGALGYSVHYYFAHMFAGSGLRPLVVDGIAPDDAAIRDQRYPLCGAFYAAIRSSEAYDSPARTLYEWLCGSDGKACLTENGYVSAL